MLARTNTAVRLEAAKRFGFLNVICLLLFVVNVATGLRRNGRPGRHRSIGEN